jgi:beta-galactosidase
MILKFFTLSLSLFISVAAAQDIGRVSPASLPLPMPSAKPIAPDVLQSHNPWNLPMTGMPKFALTHGRIQAGTSMRPSSEQFGISASSNEKRNPPENAFDGNNDTRWCSSDDSVPHWLETDLGKERRVTGISLAWEHADAGYQCLIEGKKDGGKWVTLADASAEPGIGDGPVMIAPAEVRFVRVTVAGHAAGSWASLR